MYQIGESLTITKFKAEKTAPFSYPGEVIGLGPGSVTIKAFFNLDDRLVHGVIFKRGDLFIETYYKDRWYNIFEVHDRDTGLVKCWYCNVAQPAVFEKKAIWFIDLALDLMVFADQQKEVLDQDEFDLLNLPEDLFQAATAELEDLKKMAFVEYKRSGTS